MGYDQSYLRKTPHLAMPSCSESQQMADGLGRKAQGALRNLLKQFKQGLPWVVVMG